MLRTNLYLTEEQNEMVYRLAGMTKKPKATVLRNLIGLGLKNSPVAKSSCTQGLLKLARLAEKLSGKGPKDLSINLDKYAWDE